MNGSFPESMIRDSSDQRFMADVLEASHSAVVLVDFHAAWCAPCRQLTPLLEKAVHNAKGRLRLVKIDIDRNQMIAAQLRISSIPAVFAFYKGNLVDSFFGAMSSAQLDRFVKALLQQSRGGDGNAEETLQEAQAAFDQGDLQKAARGFEQVLRLMPQSVAAGCGLVRCHLNGGNLKKAEQTLKGLSQEIKTKSEMIALEEAFESLSGLKPSTSVSTLTDLLERDPNDHRVRYELAIALYLEGRKDGAVFHLLEIVDRALEWEDQKARKLLVTLFEVFGPRDGLTVSSRRRLSSILFR